MSSSPASERRRGVEQWVADHREELHRHLTGMLDDPDEAEDVLQEVWLAAHRSPPEDRREAGARAWLYRVATNAALDRLTRRRRRARILERGAPDLEPASPPEADADLFGAGEELRAAVRTGVARLPRKQREAVWLRWLEGREYDEIARELGSSREAARANVYQGLRKLRTELRSLWSEEVAG